MINLNNISTICTPIIISILGLAFPLIIQTVTHIDTKYDSQRLIARFKNESLYKHLWVSLIASILLLAYNRIVILPWEKDWGVINVVMVNSSNLLLAFSTLYLVIILFFIIRLLIKYLDYQSLFNMLYAKVKNKYQQKDDILDFVEVGKYILFKDDNLTAPKFYQFLNDYIDSKSIQNSSTEETFIQFDNWFYNAILSINDALCKNNIQPISIVNGSDFIKLLITSQPEHKISDRSFIVLWHTLHKQLFYKKFEWVYDYWSHAHQYCWITLKSSNYFTPYNSEKIEGSEEEIIRVREFHIALCSYILYLKEYNLLKKLTQYTQSEPYQFPLIPSSFTEIFTEYCRFDNDCRTPLYFEDYYSFPGIKGINAGTVSLGWYKKYLTLLLFRLNSFEVTNISSFLNPWDFPYIENNPKKTKASIEAAEQMIRFAEMWVQKDNIETLKILGWSIDLETDPIGKLKEFTKSLEQKFEQSQIGLVLSKDRLNNLKNNTIRIIDDNSYIYCDVLKSCSGENVEGNTDYKPIEVIDASITRVAKKDLFSDGGVINNANYDTIDAQIAVRNFVSDYSLMFLKHTKHSYTINSDDCFAALDRMIGSNLGDYTVIAFGVNFYQFTKDRSSEFKLKTESNEQNRYIPYSYKDNLDIHSLPSPKNRVMDNVVLIIKKNNLPCFKNVEPSNDLITNFKLEQAIVPETDDNNNNLKVFVSVLFDSYPKEYENLENSDHCLVFIHYCVRFLWKSDSDVTLLKLITPYMDSGNGMNVEELPIL